MRWSSTALHQRPSIHCWPQIMKFWFLMFRQPLDLLADPEIIVGAKRIPPKDLMENPTLIPKEKDSVVYCTCPDDKTSRVISRRALAMHFLRIKFLKGGLAGWKAKGYPVELYKKPFHLDTRT